MYMVILSILSIYLRCDEVTNHEGQGQHQHLHAITCHLGILFAININVVEMGSVCCAQCDHRGVCHHCGQTFRQSFPNCLKPSVGDQGLPLTVDKIRTPQDLYVTIQHCRHNVVTKEAEIPGNSSTLVPYTCIYKVH